MMKKENKEKSIELGNIQPFPNTAENSELNQFNLGKKERSGKKPLERTPVELLNFSLFFQLISCPSRVITYQKTR